MRFHHLGVMFCASLLLLVACDRGTPPAAATIPEGAKLAKVVFIGQLDVCDCTARSIDESYAALEAALGNPPKVPIERLELDANPKEVEPYQKDKAIMALPAVFFVDEAGKILSSVQGPQTKEQFEATLGGALLD
ncbi:MAG: hypothetical protein RBU37_03520 [Myxococcota bacterium]|jgi:hypothetical protein|nr:hypothetical protein [Myxococcota bacterium]